MNIYVEGFVAAVPAENKDAYSKLCAVSWPLFQEYGALQLVECWGDDVPEGKVTDFRRAVQAKDGEVVVFSWIVWPSKEVRDAGQLKMREDPRMEGMELPFDGARMIYGGFVPVFDSGARRAG